MTDAGAPMDVRPAGGRPRDWWSSPHHDGSRRFTPGTVPSVGEAIPLLLLEPVPGTFDRCTLRYSAEGDGYRVEADIAHVDECGRWWTVDLPYTWPETTYRFELVGETRAYLNARGLQRSEPADNFDFRIDARPSAPQWLVMSVVYQIFLDRFARGGPPHAETCEWTDPVRSEWPDNVKQFYGGDLSGILQRLPYLQMLGVSTLLLTPFFPAPESHRYCASDFDRVDPMLGGDAALVSLVTGLHDVGMHCLGDLTLNHCGSDHQWFRRAMGRPDANERRLFHFDAWPDVYDSYHGVPSLPRFNYSTEETFDRMIDGEGAVARRWLRPPYRLDGWRVDVAGSTGRQSGRDHNTEVRQRLQTAVASENPDAFITAEIPRDPSADLQGDGWPSALLDAGFCSPVRRWLSGDAGYGGVDLVESLTTFAAQISWRTLVSSLNFLGSHDYPRFASVVGGPHAVKAGFFLQLTSVAIPLVFAGDEVALEGPTADTARLPMPWHSTDIAPAGDGEVLALVRELTALRREQSALTDGGLRWLRAWPQAIMYERATQAERIVCIVARDDCILECPPLTPFVEPLIRGSARLQGPPDARRIHIEGPRRFGLWRMTTR